MEIDKILWSCSNDQLDQVIEECHLFKQGFYGSKEELVKALRNIIYTEQ